MIRITFFVALFVFFMSSVFAGGLLTNANQSAQYIRMLSRNASTDIDAVYFNPAGLIQLPNGWHFALYSQTILQDKTVASEFPLLNDGRYGGEVTIPVFPTAFAVYKKENWAFSFGFGPNAGGGVASFERGLPSFEIPITKVVPALAGLSQIDPALSVSAYDADLSFEGHSVFWGLQLGASYKVSEVFSVYGGLRYLPSKNSYTGSIKNVQLKVGGNMVPAPDFLAQTSGLLSGKATQLSTAAEGLQPLIDNGAGGFTLDQLEKNDQISAAQREQVEGGLMSIGYTQAQIDVLTVTSAQAGFSTTSAQLEGKAAALSNTAEDLEDRQVDTEQTGAGFTPIAGLNFSPNDKLNIAVKYEMKTKLKLTNKTKVDDLGLFPEGEKTRSDIPAVLTLGAGYKAMKWLETQLSYSLYFDKGVSWGRNVRDLVIWEDVDPSKIRERNIDHNYWELALGLQFNLTDRFAVSIGGMRSAAGIADDYQSDFSYSNPSYTGGLGFMWKMSNRLTWDAGFSNSFYEDRELTFNDPDAGPYTDVYGKRTTSFAAGLSYRIF